MVKTLLVVTCVLQENVGLKILNLKMNGFGADGAKVMAHALMHNRTLMNLDLSSNRIPIAGAVALGKGINSNEILTHIKVSLLIFVVNLFRVSCTLLVNVTSRRVLVDKDAVLLKWFRVQISQKFIGGAREGRLLVGLGRVGYWWG